MSKKKKIGELIFGGDIDQALELANVEDIEFLFEIGAFFGQKGEHNVSERIFSRIVQLDSSVIEAWLNRGLVLGHLEKYDEAIKSFDKAIEINPNDDKAWRNKGLALVYLGKYDEAIKSYDKAIEINPNDDKTWHGKGVALVHLEKYDEAIKSYDKGIKINPSYDKVWYNKGVALDRLEKYDEAIKSFDKAIEINPNDDKAWLNKGAALDSLGKHDEAIECYHKALEINPAFAMAHGNLGITFLVLSQYEDAIENLRKAKDLFLESGLVDYAAMAIGYELQAKGLKSWISSEYEKATSHFIEAISIFRNLNLMIVSNSLELISEMVPLDRQFMDALNSRSLFDLKEKSLKICKGITDLNDRFTRKPLIEDAKEILIAKYNCFTALCSALEFERPKPEVLDTARRIFEKRRFATSVLAVNSLDIFIQCLSVYENLEEVPEDIANILLQALQASRILDGVLTRAISAVEYYKHTSSERLEKPEIRYQFIEDRKKDWVRVCLVQLDFSVDRILPPEDFGYILKEKEKIEKKVFEALEIAKKNKVDIIVFPELSVVEEWVGEAKNRYQNMIIVFGTYYKNGFNTCPIIVEGQDYYIQKLNPSPQFETEFETGRHMKKGKKILVLQTKCGKIVVLICMDYIKEVHQIIYNPHKEISNVDFIIVPEYNKDVKLFQEHGNLDCQKDNCPYILQVNAWKVLGREVGGTCVIGMEHKGALERYIIEDVKPDDKILYKLIETKKSVTIVDLDINRKGPPLPPSGPKMKLILSEELG